MNEESINKSRTMRRGLELMKIYTKNRKVVPTLDVFINDYFKIVEPAKSNQFLIKKTSQILKEVYDDFLKDDKTKIAVTLIL